MKKIIVLAVAAMMATTNIRAQEVQPYIQLDQLPKLINIMPAPPAFDSPEFANDAVRYGWGKEQRQNAERLALAIADAEWFDHTKLFAQWKDAFGLEITETGTPEIWKLMETSLATTDPMRKETKAFYHRQRPFERYNDPMPSHEEDGLRGEGSYPSGHSLRGWTISLLLAQIAPERADGSRDAARGGQRGWRDRHARHVQLQRGEHFVLRLPLQERGKRGGGAHEPARAVEWQMELQHDPRGDSRD